MLAVIVAVFGTLIGFGKPVVPTMITDLGNDLNITFRLREKDCPDCVCGSLVHLQGSYALFKCAFTVGNSRVLIEESADIASHLLDHAISRKRFAL